MKRELLFKRKFFTLLMSFVLVVSAAVGSMTVSFANELPVIKNVIYMIPDGGGLALLDFTNAVKEAGGFNPGLYPNATSVTSGPMHLKEYLIGTETTHSASHAVTDSAASGTALSSGYKTVNGYIGIDQNKIPRATILEAAQLAGKRAGICATYEWSHATPASFTAHDISRGNYPILSEQIVNQGLDVVLGVGFGVAQWGSLDEAVNRGYTIINNKTELTNVTKGTKIWGNLNNQHFPYDINLSSAHPNLAEMTGAALTALDGSENGFVLMVEGSQVDTAAHSNNLVGAVSEFLAFDAAFKVALDFAQSRNDTVVIALPDHDTGGLILPGAASINDGTGGNPDSTAYAAAVAEIRAGRNNLISWETGNHTDRKCGIWMYAPPGVPVPEGLSAIRGDTPATRKLVVDNTEIAPYLAGLLGLDLERATQELFQDVTDMGSYNPSNGVFTFYDLAVTIKANTSVAEFDSKPYDLNGQVAVYSNGRFYVPAGLSLFVLRESQRSSTEVETVRYIDDLTGRILVKGQVNKALQGKRATLLLSKKNALPITANDIGAIEEVRIGKNGDYVFTFVFNGDVSNYDLTLRIGNQAVTSSITSVTASYSWLDTSLNLSLVNGSLVSSGIEINNYFDLEGLTYTVGLFFYDEHDKLLGLRISNGVKPVGATITTDSLDAAVIPGTANVKATVWSNYIQMIPLCASKTVN